MMKHPRLLSLLIALVLCLFVGAAGAEVTSTTTTYTVDAEALGLPSNDELFAYYVEQKLYGYEWATFNRAVDQLSERQQKLYAHLEAALEKIATGQTASTVVVVDATTLSTCGYSATGSISTQEEYNAAAEQFSTEIDADFDVVNAALVIDHPFEMYWYDKQTQLRCSFPLKNGNELDFSATFTFYPVENFQPASGYDEEAPTVDTAKTSAATSATTKAQEIVAKYASVSDYEKIIGYMNEICALTSYNDAAAETVKNGTDYGSNGPWQLLWVFDGYTSTEVVCEGYAKAFQYLCDLTTFDSALVESRIVTGSLSEGIGAGPHMWNVVTMDDGYNYIVDVTNTDGNSVGNQGQFKLGGTSNYQTNYDPTPDTADNWGDTYAFYCNAQQTMYFTYDSDMTSVYTPADLALAPYNYADVAYITAADGTITGYAEIEDAVSAWTSGSTLTLLDDCKTKTTIDISSDNLILNLNGFTLQNKISAIPVITNTGNLQITGPGTIIAGSYGVGIENASGTLTISGNPIINCTYTFRYVNGTLDLTNATPTAIDGWTVFNNTGATMDATAIAKIELPSDYALCDNTTKAPLSTLTNNKTATITTPVATTYVAEVDGTKYAEFSTALNAWKASGTTTLTLLSDVNLVEDEWDYYGIKVDGFHGDKVLDLNGNKLTNPNGYVLSLAQSIQMTIKDSVGDGIMASTESNWDAILIYENSGPLTIKGGTIEAARSAIVNYSALTISGNTVIQNTHESIAAIINGGNMIISGDVQIDASVDIYTSGESTNLTAANKCEGWLVRGKISPTIPDGYSLLDVTASFNSTIPSYIVQRITHTHSHTIVDKDATHHWNKCECGEMDESSKTEHTYTSYTSIDGITHTAACACGATVTEPHTLSYTSAGNGTHNVTCTKNCGYSATAVTCTNVTCTPVTETTTYFRHTVYCNDCKNEYTEGCNTGTCNKCGAHGVIVDNKRLTSANAGNVLGDGKVSYDAAAQTLTLSNANTTYIDSNHDLTVTYSGNNTLSQYIGVSGKDLVLNATSGAKLTAASIGGSLTSNVTINGGTVNLSDTNNPIDANTLTISNAIVTAHASDSFVPTINLAGKLTLDGNSHLKATRDQDGYAITFKGFEGNGYYRTAANGTFTKAESISVSTYIDGYYEYVGTEHLPKFVDDEDGKTHSATCACGTKVTENHTYNANNICTGCGVSNTVTITLYANGAKIVEINGEAKEILHGGTFTVPHGQELKVKFENTLSKWETGVRVSAGTADYPVFDFTYDEATNIMTIPASVVNQDFYIGANAYVRVQFNLHGGTLTKDGEAEFNYVGHTWNAKNATLKAAGSLIFFEPEYFQLDGHTCAGAMVEGSDVVEKVALEVTGDATVDILWNCTDTTTTLTHVEAKDATCIAEGNIAHYKCTCGKLYEDEYGINELTAEQVKTGKDSSNHVGMDSATGKCQHCKADMAVASVTIGSDVTYYAMLDDALDDAADYTATVKLLADGEITQNANYDSPSNVTIDMNGKSITAGQALIVADEASLTITGSGTISATEVTPISNEGATVKISGDITFVSTKPEFTFSGVGTLDLSGVTGSMNGWRVDANGITVTVGDELILPDDYALKVGEIFVTTLATREIGTIVAHTEHDYVDGVCGCGAECAHTNIDDNGLCPECGLQHVASVTIGSEVTYYKTLQEAMAAANGQTATVTLLAECELNNDFAIAGGNIELRLNNQTITATQTLTVSNGATLTIEGEGNYIYNGNNFVDVISVEGTLNISGGTFSAVGDFAVLLQAWGQVNISGGSFTAEGNQSIPVSISGNVTVSGAAAFFGSTECGEFAITSSGMLDLSGVTGSMDGWRVWNNYATNGVVVGTNLILPLLPDGYALKLGEEFVTSLAGDQIGTIVAHTHNYTTPQKDDHHHWEECACGATTKKVEHTFTYTPVTGKEVHTVGCSGCTYAAPETPPHEFTNGVCDCSATPVAKVGDTQYAYFANAVAAWTDGTTLTLLADVTYDNYIPIAEGETRTFVGGEYTLDLVSNRISNKGTLTIQSGTIKTQDANALMVYGTATINSDNVKLQSMGSQIAVYEPKGLTITGTGCDGWKIWNNHDSKEAPITIPDGFHLEDKDGNQLAVNDKLLCRATTVIKADHNHNWSYTADDTADTITATCSADGCRTPSVVVSLPDAQFTYDGSEKSVAPTYSVSNSGIAEATVTYTGERTYVTTAGFTATMTLGEVKVSKTYFIMPFSLTQTQIGYIADQPYTGAAIEPEISVTWADITLEKGTDYTVTYSANVNVGEATVTVTGKGNYTGETKAVFNITPASIAKATIPAIADQPYTGEEIKPAVTVTMGNKTLVEGTDYTVAYENNINVGKATVTVTGMGNYTRTASTTFEITPADAVVSVNTYLDDTEQDTFTYGQTITVKGQVAIDAAAQTFALRATPVNTAELYYGETKLAEATVAADNTFTLTYDTTEKKLPVGSHTLTVEFGGTGNLADESTTVAITLNAKSLTVTGAIATSRTYDGTNKVAIAEVTLDGVIEGDEVSVNVDGLKGTISSADASEYTTVTLPDALPLIGDHAAFYTAAGTTVNANVTISAKVVTVTDLTIELEPATFVYDGNAKKPAVTVKDGETIIDPSEYTVSYQNNTNVGTADAKPTVTITDNAGGNYTVSGTKEFTITQSASAVTAKSYLGDAEQDTFTYGQTITVKGQAAIDAAAQTFALRATPVNTAALYYGETKLAEATVAADNTFILTYDTTGKALPIGTSTLTVEFGGTGNLADESTTVAITLNAKSLTVTSATATSRTYDGTTDVAITEVTLDGVIEGDEVSVNVDGLKGTISSANAGEYTTVTLPEELPLIGDHAAFYTAAGTEVDSTVTISAKVVTVTDLTIELTPATFVYDGTAKEPAVTVKDGETIIPATEYTVSYQNNTEVGDATVNIADAEGGNYTVSGSATFKITKGNSDLTAATYLNDVATTDFTYGDVITVKGQATLQQTFALRQVEINKAALFYGDVQLGEPVAVGEDGTYTLTYDTTGKGLAIGENTLTVVYGGSGNLAGQTATVKVTLNKADPEVNIPADLTATYGKTLADVTLPDGFAWNTPTAPVGDAGSNTHKATFTPSDTDYYNTAEVDVSITVGKLALTGVTLPENVTLPTYCATADEAKAQLLETVAYTGTDSKTYALPATWSCTDYNVAPDSESIFTWTVAAEQANFTFADDVAITGTITVKNGTAVAVTITGTDTTITYDGNPFDVSAMFTIDVNAGATTYSIVSNGTDTGAGTLEGSVLTITKAGTITIQVNTAANTVEGTPYAPGEATAVLTVSKGTLNVTAPTGLTASYGDTLASVKLPADANGTWAWKDTSAETKVGDAGERTHTAIFTPNNTNLWDAVEVDVTITVTKAAIILDGMAATYLDNEAKTEFVYGQTITVRATPVMPAVLNARIIVAPEPNQMALFIGSTQISAPADADANGTYTMTYATTEKVLPIGAQQIEVRYVGTNNISDGSFFLDVTLLPAELEVSIVTLKDRTYEPGNTQVEVTAATLSGILGTDEVLADTAKMLCILKADGAMSDKAGSYTEVILPETIPLTGAHASFYTAKGGTAINATVSITKATPEATGTPDMGDVTPGTQLKDVPTDAIEELYKPVEGTVTWDNPEETVEPGKEYDYTFTPNDQENYEPVEGSTVIIPLAPPQPEVPPVVLPTVIVPAEDQLVTVYEGETADMSVTAINADAYQWYINRNDGMGWRPIIGANTPAYTTSVTTLNDDGYLYICRVSNADGAVNSPVFTLDVLPALDVPPTGDNAPVMLWASLLLMSAALMIMTGKKRRFN